MYCIGAPNPVVYMPRPSKMCRVTRLAPSASLVHSTVHTDFSLVLAYQFSEHGRGSALTLCISPMEQTYLIDAVRRGVGYSLEEAPPTTLTPWQYSSSPCRGVA
jgi:hypothetical protein